MLRRLAMAALVLACGGDPVPAVPIELEFPSFAMQAVSTTAELGIWPLRTVSCDLPPSTAPVYRRVSLSAGATSSIGRVDEGGASVVVVVRNASDEPFLAGCASAATIQRGKSVRIRLGERRESCQHGAVRGCYDGPGPTQNRGSCRAGHTVCLGGTFLPCLSQRLPIPERCNGLDDDCNGGVDEATACARCPGGCGAREDCCDGRCQDVETDRDHCGRCGHACSTASDACCAGACVDLQSSHASCGACGHACSADETCCAGRCVDLRSDLLACGGCGHACAGGAERCCAGECVRAATCTCDSRSCPDGCCTVDGTCRAGVTEASCGLGPQPCATCAAGLPCARGQCAAPDGGGAGLGGAGGPGGAGGAGASGAGGMGAGGAGFGGGGAVCGLSARQWRLVASTGPPSRMSAAMAYDEPRQQILLFGGEASAGPLGDTWSWKSSTWSPRASAAEGPGPRAGAAMAYHPGSGRVVLFGGTPAGDDTWTWNGSWAQVTPSPNPSPPARSNATMTLDPVSGELVLFGGSAGGAMPAALGDTWIWNGSGWRVLPGQAPPPRSHHGAASHPTERVLVVVGTNFQAGPQPADTWAFSGAGWTRRATSTYMIGPALALDESLGTALMFGGLTFQAAPTLLGATQAWRSSAAEWCQYLTSGPSSRYSAVMAYDRSRSRVVLFGGSDSPEPMRPAGFLGDTWELGP